MPGAFDGANEIPQRNPSMTNSVACLAAPILPAREDDYHAASAVVASSVGPAACECGEHGFLQILKRWTVFFSVGDMDFVCKKNWFIIGKSGKYPYAASSVTYRKKTNQQTMHRLLAGAEAGMVVDHKNGDTLDNRKENLRACTHSENMANRIKRCTSRSKFKGVYREKNGWRAQCRFNGKIVKKRARTEEEAAEIYNQLAAEMQGEFARLNDLEVSHDARA
jgi:hypothetical protein